MLIISCVQIEGCSSNNPRATPNCITYLCILPPQYPACCAGIGCICAFSGGFDWLAAACTGTLAAVSAVSHLEDAHCLTQGTACILPEFICTPKVAVEKLRLQFRFCAVYNKGETFAKTDSMQPQSVQPQACISALTIACQARPEISGLGRLIWAFVSLQCHASQMQVA